MGKIIMSLQFSSLIQLPSCSRPFNRNFERGLPAEDCELSCITVILYERD